jgi:Raf kinase inhibitor-like YbhB/YbcL family protein
MRPTTFVGFLIAIHIVSLCSGCEPSKKPAPPDKSPSDTTQKTGEKAMSVKIESPTVKNNERIPVQFTGDGKDVSPQLSWSGVPDGTAELALIMDDPDAPTPEPWVHWVIYKIPADTKTLPENVAKTETLTTPAGAMQGKNSWDKIGYGGPAPPPGHGTHHYYFKLYALDRALSVAPGLTKNQLLSAMKGHILAEGELMGTYER